MRFPTFSANPDDNANENLPSCDATFVDNSSVEPSSKKIRLDDRPDIIAIEDDDEEENGGEYNPSSEVVEESDDFDYQAQETQISISSYFANNELPTSQPTSSTNVRRQDWIWRDILIRFEKS